MQPTSNGKIMKLFSHVKQKDHHYLIIGSYPEITGMGGWGSGPRGGTGGLGQYKTYDMGESVWDGPWRPGGAFFQTGLGCAL